MFSAVISRVYSGYNIFVFGKLRISPPPKFGSGSTTTTYSAVPTEFVEIHLRWVFKTDNNNNDRRPDNTADLDQSLLVHSISSLLDDKES